MKKRFFIAPVIVMALLMGAVGCAKDETVYYQEWRTSWLTPTGTELEIIGEYYKPIQEGTNKQIGRYVTEANGTVVTIQYPILQKNVSGKWVVTSNGYDRERQLANYALLADEVLNTN